jgi:hypothetical protein
VSSAAPYSAAAWKLLGLDVVFVVNCWGSMSFCPWEVQYVMLIETIYAMWRVRGKHLSLDVITMIYHDVLLKNH